MGILKFYRGLSDSYNASTHADGIYFCTDTGEIRLNGKQYGSSGKTVKDVALQEADLESQKEAGLLITYTDKSTSLIKLSELAGVYTSGIDNEKLEMPSTVGGISKGTTVEALNGKTINQMFDDLLFPTVNPTFTAPTASIAWKSYNNVQEVGATGPTEANFTCTYNAGAINLNGSKQADRGGALKEDESFIYVNNTVSNTTLPAKVAEGATTFKYRAVYEAGAQPKDNKGNNYGTPLAAGTVDSNAITLNGVFPVFASTSASNNPVKQSLSTATTLTLTLASCNSGNVVYKLPSKMTSCKQENPMKPNVFDVEGLTYYTESTNTENINGVEHTYYIYTYNSSSRGSLKEQIKF